MSSAQGDPIFVLGYQRSGTTLLQSMLGARPAIAGPPEIYFFMRIAALEPYYGDLHDDTNLRRALHDMIHIETLGGYRLDEDEMFASLCDGARTYRELLTTLMDAIAARHGKRRWSEKSPGPTCGADPPSLPGRQAYLHRAGPARHRRIDARGALVEASARRVALDVRAHIRAAMHAAAQVGPDRYLRVRYEHRPWQRGVSEPVRTGRKACGGPGSVASTRPESQPPCTASCRILATPTRCAATCCWGDAQRHGSAR